MSDNSQPEIETISLSEFTDASNFIISQESSVMIAIPEFTVLSPDFIPPEYIALPSFTSLSPDWNISVDLEEENSKIN
jgi:hypothetical protein